MELKVMNQSLEEVMNTDEDNIENYENRIFTAE